MNRTKHIAICVLTLLFVYEGLIVYAQIQSSTTIGTRGSIVPDEVNYVKPFGFRIADMMADLLQPNFDDRWYSTYWQEALDDLAAACPNHEITHAQMRIWWRLNGDTPADWINPVLGSPDPTQSQIMPNWKRWYFGYVAPQESPLAYGPSAIQRIHQKGFKFEFCISGAWDPSKGDPAKPPMFWWGGNESDYPEWMALGGGEKFLDNYLNNVLLPVANFAKDYLENGDIFMLSFEMNYPTSDFTWSHNEKWESMINAVRNVFRAAGKSIVLTIDHCGWYDDFGLGYSATKSLNPNAPITSASGGISGATYLGELDFISVSWWLPVILPGDVPSNWSDADIARVTDAWFNNKNNDKVGTGYSGIPAVRGRDTIADLRALSTVIGRRVLMNTGWVNRHGWLAWDRSIPITADNAEQRVAWAAQLGAIGDPRSNFTVWCAGQDFERYCRDKAAQPTYIETSWRKAPAESAILQQIRSILGIG